MNSIFIVLVFSVAAVLFLIGFATGSEIKDPDWIKFASLILFVICIAFAGLFAGYQIGHR